MPSGIRIVSRRGSRITATVPIPVGADGTAGRKCPSCRRYFKVDAQALGGVTDLWCPYCGHPASRDEFLTLDQLRRIRSAFARLAMAEVSRMFDDVFRPLQRTTGPIQIGYERGRTELPPLLTYLEEGTVRERTCRGCGNRFAVFGIAIFCPFCGRRDGFESFTESIDAARSLLAAVVHLPVSSGDSSKPRAVRIGSRRTPSAMPSRRSRCSAGPESSRCRGPLPSSHCRSDTDAMSSSAWTTELPSWKASSGER